MPGTNNFGFIAEETLKNIWVSTYYRTMLLVRKHCMLS
jgi:hypothetical protein